MTLLTTAEVAKQLRLSHSHTKRLISKGELPHIKINRSVRVDQKELDKWLTSKRVRETGSSLKIQRGVFPGE